MGTPIAENQDPVRILVDADPEGQVQSVVPISWCISEEIADQITNKKIVDPHLLIVISNDGRELERRLVPLMALMDYVQFRNSGTNTIHAMVVWKRNGKSIKEQIEDRYDNGGYRMTLLAHRQLNVERLESELNALSDSKVTRTPGKSLEWSQQKRSDSLAALREELREAYGSDERVLTIRSDFDDINSLEIPTWVEVEVPEEMFAAEPPAWMRWLGEFFSFWPKPKAVDQCDLRRRAMLSACLLPLWAIMQAGKAVFFTVFWFIALLNIGLMLFLGKRNIDFDVLRSSPAPSDIKRVWKGTKPSVWWYKRDKDYWCGFNKRRSPLVTINPTGNRWTVAVGGVLLFLGVYRGLTEIAVNIAAVLLVVVLAIWINSMIAEKWSSSRAAKARAKEN